MVLEIKDFISPDIKSVWDWKPNDLEEVYYLLEMEIGYKDRDGSDIFEVVVATPEAIRAREKNLPRYLPGKDYLIVLSYDWNSLENELNRIVKECSASTWEECVKKLCRYFSWEYEDHEYV